MWGKGSGQLRGEEIAMVFKWLGSLLILSVTGGFGVWSAMRWRGRLRLLKKPRQMIYFLKGEITYSHAPPAKRLEHVGRRDPGPLGTLFALAAEGIYRQEEESLQEIWNREVELLSSPKVRFPLTDENLEQLTGLGGCLGYLDVDMQERTLKLYLKQLNLSTDYLRTNQRKRYRLYINPGIMEGIFFVIMIY